MARKSGSARRNGNAARSTYARAMEILLWLAPAAVVTLATMLWVGWWGRDGRGHVDRETAARRLGEALSREPRGKPGYAVPRRAPERVTGVALRRAPDADASKEESASNRKAS